MQEFHIKTLLSRRPNAINVADGPMPIVLGYYHQSKTEVSIIVLGVLFARFRTVECISKGCSSLSLYDFIVVQKSSSQVGKFTFYG